VQELGRAESCARAGGKKNSAEIRHGPGERPAPVRPRP
jgi:hypothetical protein